MHDGVEKYMHSDNSVAMSYQITGILVGVVFGIMAMVQKVSEAMSTTKERCVFSSSIYSHRRR